MTHQEIIDHIRSKLNDYAEYNFEESQEFTDSQIETAMQDAIWYFNEVPPQTTYDEDGLITKWPGTFVDTAIMKCLYNKALYYQRQGIQAPGVTPSVEAQRAQYYLSASARMEQEIKPRIVAIKVESNMSDAFEVVDLDEPT